MSENPQRIRLDKWLWAARFFKTRSLAKQAIDGGKVRVNGERAKASKEIERGMVLTLRRGWDDVSVEVLELSDQRRGAPEAQKLYRETQESIEKRQLRAEERRAFGGSVRSDTKPNTKERRMLHKIKRDILDNT
ncbi:MAG: RNA-binding protein [Agarilytica sp.]